jgi:hypothetical protein
VRGVTNGEWDAVGRNELVKRAMNCNDEAVRTKTALNLRPTPEDVAVSLAACERLVKSCICDRRSAFENKRDEEYSVWEEKRVEKGRQAARI